MSELLYDFPLVRTGSIIILKLITRSVVEVNDMSRLLVSNIGQSGQNNYCIDKSINLPNLIKVQFVLLERLCFLLSLKKKFHQ